MKKKQRTEDSIRWSKEEMDVALLLRTLPRCRTWFFIGQMPYNPTGKRSSPPQLAAAAVVAPPCNPVVKEHASSPNTPLSFPLSFPVTESDEKTEPSQKKSSLKRKKEQYLKNIEDLTNTKAALNQELETVKRHFAEVKDLNLKLKAKEQELLNGTKSDCKIPKLVIHQEPEVQLGQLNDYIKSLKSTAENEVLKQQQQMQMLPIANQFQYMLGNLTTSLQIRSNVASNKGPLLLPDLNMSNEELIHVESCQPLDESQANKSLIKAMAAQAMAAQARQRRLLILRLKKPFGNVSKSRQSHR